MCEKGEKKKIRKKRYKAITSDLFYSSYKYNYNYISYSMVIVT